MEVFGPTIQGEGPDAGMPCYFVRFGGCDYRCEWCDSMHAVDPALVRENATRMDTTTILGALDALPGQPGLVVLSGGNPALHHLQPLVLALKANGYLVSVETQGSVWRGWLASTDRLVISPKPPSSGMLTDKHRRQTDQFLTRALEFDRNHPTFQWAVAKLVMFDAADLAWAVQFTQEVPQLPLFLSMGTRPNYSPAEMGEQLAELYEAVAMTPELSHARVLPQLHVIAWGHAQGA